MPTHKTLYLLRRPIADGAGSLLPSISPTASPGSCSLVLLEAAVLPSPSSFPGPVYVLRSASNGPMKPTGEKTISYSELVALIGEHDTTVVL